MLEDFRRARHLDVNNEKSVTEGINRIYDEKETIDVVVNNAGYWLIGALEETSMDKIKAQFETQLFWSSKSDASGNTYDEKAERK